MPRGLAAPLILLLILHGGWSCLDLTCYTDYLWTITCVLETWSPNPSILSLTCPSQPHALNYCPALGTELHCPQP